MRHLIKGSKNVVNLMEVYPGQTLYEVCNFSVVEKEVLRADYDHIHFKYSMRVSKAAGLNNLFCSEKEALLFVTKQLKDRVNRVNLRLFEIERDGI